MVTVTVYSNSSNTLSWKSNDQVETQKTTYDDTTVNNSHTAAIWWKLGTTSGSIASSSSMICDRDVNDQTWQFSESDGGTVRITLTVSGTGSK
jgi:hypothetical protein